MYAEANASMASLANAVPASVERHKLVKWDPRLLVQYVVPGAI